MKVLVTGSSGFIGGHLVDGLVREGHDVRCFARKKEKAKRLLDMGLEVVYGDIRNIDSLRPAVKGVDCIFHAAAKVADWGKWEEFYEDTVLGTENILQIAADLGVKHFLQISTVDVYDIKFFGSNLPRIGEDTPIGRNFGSYYYAKAKMLAEEKVFQYHNSGKIRAVVIRPATVYGPRDMTTFPRIIEFLKDKSAGLISAYNPYIGLIYVTDVADLCIRASMKREAFGNAYNAATNWDIKIDEFLDEICKAMNLPRITRKYPYWLMYAIATISECASRIAKKNTPPLVTKVALRLFTLDQRFNIYKSQKELNWKPQINFSEGLMETVKWAKRTIKL